MKTTDYLKSLRSKDVAGLKAELEALRKEQFNLRMQSAIGQATQSHLVTGVRKKVAQVKTLINQQQAKA
jgi:large subunit ribosomal protein L29